LGFLWKNSRSAGSACRLNRRPAKKVEAAVQPAQENCFAFSGKFESIPAPGIYG
jgi:hypothetical protein